MKAKKNSPMPLTVEELRELENLVWGERVDRGIAGSILHSEPEFAKYGLLCEESEAQILHWSEMIQTYVENEQDGPVDYVLAEVHREIGSIVASAVRRKDVAFFERLWRMVGAIKKGASLNDIPPEKLGIKRGRGRKTKPYDLKIVGRQAVERVATLRFFGVNGKPPKLERITRDELRKAIRDLQHENGLMEMKQLPEGDLSRIITQMGIGKFMDAPKNKPVGKPPPAWKD